MPAAPTFLMGATLPVVARWIDATPRGVSLLGLFYGGNIAGGVAMESTEHEHDGASADLSIKRKDPVSPLCQADITKS